MRGLRPAIWRSIKRVCVTADEYPSAFAGGAFLCLFATLFAWSGVARQSVLLGRASGGRRTIIYGEFAQTAVAIIAVVLTVLAILYALPDRPAIADLRSGGGWLRLQRLLLSIAGLALITLISAHVGTAVDHGAHGITWLEDLMLSAAVTGVAAAAVAGLAFALSLQASTEPRDPSEGRGQGSRT